MLLTCNRIQMASCIVVSAIIVVIFSPYIFNFDGGREDYNNSSYADLMRNNIVLKGADLIAIGSSMPLMFTVSLDMVWPISTTRYSCYESICLIFITVVPMAAHLVASNYHWGPHFTLCVANTSVVLWAFLGISCIWKTLSQLAIWSKAALVIGPFIFVLGVSMGRVGMHIAGLAVTVVSAGIFMYYGVVKWVYYIREKHGSWPWKARLDEDDSKACMWLTMACVVQCNWIFHSSGTYGWGLAGPLTRIIYQTFFMILFTTLPARLAVVQRDAAIIENLQTKREFVRYASHEIRSPLNVAIGGLHLLKEDLQNFLLGGLQLAGVISMFRKLQGDVEMVIESSEEAVKTLDNLLDYESIDSGLIKLETVSAPLRGCCNFDLKRLSRLAESRNVALLFEDSACILNCDNNVTPALSDTSITHVYFDLFRIFQIIQNLVTNAVKFSSEGESIVLKSSIELLELLPDTINSLCSPPVECNLTRSATLCIEVIDTGVGISTDKDMLFQSFQQFNRNELQGGGGSGLGLWICQKIANLHGGLMGCRSEGPGMGSTFFLYLPLYLMNPDAIDIEDQTPVLSTHSPHAVPLHPSPRSRPSLMYTSDHKVHPISPLSPLSPIPPPQLHITSASINEEETINPKSPSTSSNDLAVISNYRVLVVDDSKLNRLILKRIVLSVLKKCNSTRGIVIDDASVVFEEADDGLPAVECMERALAPPIDHHKGQIDMYDIEEERNQSFDLVLLDYVMKAMHGPDTAAAIRNLGFTGKIIGVTGNALPDDIAEFKRKGADHVLIKPLKADELAKLL